MHTVLRSSPLLLSLLHAPSSCSSTRTLNLPWVCAGAPHLCGFALTFSWHEFLACLPGKLLPIRQMSLPSPSCDTFPSSLQTSLLPPALPLPYIPPSSEQFWFSVKNPGFGVRWSFFSTWAHLLSFLKWRHSEYLFYSANRSSDTLISNLQSHKYVFPTQIVLNCICFLVSIAS